MTEHSVQYEQSMMDVTKMTYGNQQAFFKLHEENEDVLAGDNDELEIPASPPVGTVLQYDETSILFDAENAKDRVREGISIATLKESLI